MKNQGNVTPSKECNCSPEIDSTLKKSIKYMKKNAKYDVKETMSYKRIPRNSSNKSEK